MGLRKGARLPLAVVVAILIFAGVALAATGELTPEGCIADVGDGAGCGDPTQQGLNGAVGAAVSPEGTSVYVVSTSDDAIVRFGRNTATGALTPQGCISDAETAAGCGSTQQGLDGAAAVAVSADGTSVYVVSQFDDAIVHFDRNAATGALSGQGCIADTGDAAGCGTAEQGLDAARGVAVSTDGESVYVASRDDDAIVHFDRNTVDGTLTPQGCIADDDDVAGCGGTTQQGLEGAQGVAVSSDGTSVYVASSTDDAIVRFNRNTATGALSGQGCIADTDDNAGCGTTEQGLNGAGGVALSADGTSAYAASFFDDAIVRFDRNTAGGALSGQGCVADVGDVAGCGTTQQGLDKAEAVAVSADGRSTYAVASGDSAIVRFDRNTAGGALTKQGCIADVGDAAGCGATQQGLETVSGVALSVDGISAYTASFIDDAIARFAREPVPPPPGPTPDTSAPTLALKGKKTQKGSKLVKVKVTVDETATVEATGTIKVPVVKGSAAAAKTRKSKLKGQSKSLAAGESTTLKLKLKPKARKLTKKAQRKGKKAKAKVTITATDATGNEGSAKRSVKLMAKPTKN